MRNLAMEAHISHDSQVNSFLPPSGAMSFIWSRTQMLDEIWSVLKAVGTWSGMGVVSDQSGLCLSLRGQQLGHVAWDGRIDLPFGPETGKQLQAEELVSPDPERPNHVVFHVRTRADVNRAIWLFRLAYLMPDSKVDVCPECVAPWPGKRMLHHFAAPAKARS